MRQRQPKVKNNVYLKLESSKSFFLLVKKTDKEKIKKYNK